MDSPDDSESDEVGATPRKRGGSRRTPGFFDDYPEFLKTSETAPSKSRLNFRYHLIIESNVELLKDRRVVEIASHDGRWAFAALRGGGAASVVGVEPRKHLVDNANKTFEAYGIPSSSYRFYCGDGFDEAERMRREGERYDTAMVLGFLYHTGRQYEIIHKLAALDISAIIIDTAVLHNVTEPIVRLLLENTEREARLYSEGKTFDLSGIPSITAIHMMLKAAGFQPSLIVPTMEAARGGVSDYRVGRRFTIIGTR